MKSKDIAIIVAAVVSGAILSVIVSKIVFVKPSSGQTVDIVPALSANFAQPDSRFFNSSSFDPTQFITITNNQNQNPFKPGTNTGP